MYKSGFIRTRAAWNSNNKNYKFVALNNSLSAKIYRSRISIKIRLKLNKNTNCKIR